MTILFFKKHCKHIDTKNENTKHCIITCAHDKIGKLLHFIYLTQLYNRQRTNMVKFFEV